MDYDARQAEIVWLRSVVATGSQDIIRIHLPLIGYCIEVGEIAEAVRLSIIAADHFWAGGFQLKAFAVLNRALEVDPSNSELTRRHAAWSAALPPDLLAVVGLSRRHGVVPLRPLLDEQHLERITRCTIRVIGDSVTFRVAFDHDRPLPADWVAGARYALAIAGHDELIPCTSLVRDAQRFHHELELTPADAAAATALSELVRANPVTERSNILALVITTGAGPPHRVRNICYVEPLPRAAAEA